MSKILDTINNGQKCHVFYLCDALIDQGRHIGDDPVGYACTKRANYEMKGGALICDDCLSILRQDPNRISFPAQCFGKEFQKKRFEEVLGLLKDEHK